MVLGGSWWFFVVPLWFLVVLGVCLWFLVALGSSMGFLVVLVVLGGS